MHRATRTVTTLISGLFALAAARRAGADTQNGYALDRFDPSERGSGWFVADSLDLHGTLRPALGVVGEYGRRPQVFHDGLGKTALVDGQLVLHAGASLVFLDRFRFAFDLPSVLDQSGQDVVSGSTRYIAPVRSTGAGDLRLALDVGLFELPGGALRAAIGGRFWAPTGHQDDFTGDDHPRAAPHLSLAGDLGAFSWAATFGYAFRHPRPQPFAETPIGNALTGVLAVGVRALDGKLLVGPELYGSLDRSEAPGTKTIASEALLGAHLTLGSVRLGLGGGAGLGSASGVAAFRLLGGLEWVLDLPNPDAAPSDRDRDGVADGRDACPDLAGVHTDDPRTDGCPPAHGDRLDPHDKCPAPNEVSAADLAAGCPGKDSDGDGIPDALDACPSAPGARSDDPKTNGCPPDRDGDGVPDDQDACLNTPGIKSDDPAKNGCPPDADGDGIPDAQDACPKEPGPFDADPKKSGCPPVKIEQGQLKIRVQIRFKVGSAVILPESDSILASVAQTMTEHPEITRLRIEGHTDNVGSDALNKTLSAKRASSVMAALTKLGVAPARLHSVGIGAAKPIDTNTTDEGRANNRRVEFHIEPAK